MAAPAETRTPNLHRATIAHQECGWKGGDSGDAASAWQNDDSVFLLPTRWQSGPRRQGFARAAQNAPLTATGRSAKPPLTRKLKKKETRNKNLDSDRPSHGRPYPVYAGVGSAQPFVTETGGSGLTPMSAQYHVSHTELSLIMIVQSTNADSVLSNAGYCSLTIMLPSIILALRSPLVSQLHMLGE